MSNCYTIEFRLKKEMYIAVWCNETADDQDRFLLDAENSIVLFTSYASLKSTVLSDPVEQFFPSELVHDLREANELECFQELDLTEILDRLDHQNPTDLLEKDFSYLIVDCLNFFSDYAHQVGHEELIVLFKNEHVQLYWNHNYDTFFWSKNEASPEEPVQPDLGEFLKQLSKIQVMLHLACIRVI